jgi:hypothetical protein
MPGLGRKTFTAGDILTAAQVQGYLQDQAIMVFAGTEARGTAITSPSEGMFTYLSDTNALEYYDGAAWQTVGAAGGMTLISTTTLTGASVAISSIPSTYNDLQLVIVNFKPANDGARLLIRYNNNSSALYTDDAAGNTTDATATSTSAVLALGQDNTTAEGQIACDIYNYANSTTWKTAKAVSFCNSSVTVTNYTLYAPSILWRNTAAITEINLLPNSGNFTSGTAYLYGVK